MMRTPDLQCCHAVESQPTEVDPLSSFWALHGTLQDSDLVTQRAVLPV
jgi:hypothetical protein